MYRKYISDFFGKATDIWHVLYIFLSIIPPSTCVKAIVYEILYIDVSTVFMLLYFKSLLIPSYINETHYQFILSWLLYYVTLCIYVNRLCCCIEHQIEVFNSTVRLGHTECVGGGETNCCFSLFSLYSLSLEQSTNYLVQY